MKIKIMLRCLIMLAIVAGVSSTAFGADPNWIGASEGVWNLAGNWDTGAVPTATDKVNLGEETAQAKFAVTVVIINAPADANSLDIADDPNYPYTVDVYSTLTVGIDLVVGNDANGILYVGGTGSVDVGGQLSIGDNGQIGIVDVNDLATVTVTGNLEIGDDGTGTMNVYSTVSDANAVEVGTNLLIGSDGTGTLNVAAGASVVVGDDIKIGDGGNGTLTTSGAITVADELIIGDGNGDNGTLNMTGGTITGTGEIKIGNSNNVTATVNMTGGTITCSNNIKIGNDSNGGAHATVNMSGDAQIEVIGNKDLAIGQEGDATVNMSGTAGMSTNIGGGGQVVIAKNGSSDVIVNMSGDSTIYSDDQVEIGRSSGADGVLNMSENADFALKSGENLVVGANGDGELNMSGNSTLLCGTLNIAKKSDGDNSCDGKVTISGDAVLTVTEGDDDNDSGKGLFVAASQYGVGTEDGELHVTSGGTINLTADNVTLFAGLHGDAVIKFDNANFDGDDFKNMRLGGGGSGTVNMEVDFTNIDLRKDLYMACEGRNNGVRGGEAYIDTESSEWQVRKVFMACEGDSGYAEILLNRGKIEASEEFVMGDNGGVAKLIVENGEVLCNRDLYVPEDTDGDATVIIGREDDYHTSANEQAYITVKDDLQCDNRSGNDYFDFRNGSRLKLKQSNITAQKIETLIEEGYFRTTYDDDELYGVAPITGGAPGTNQEYGIIYYDGGSYWHIELAIVLVPPVCDPKPAGDLNGDCIVDLADFAILAGAWMNDTSRF